MEVTTVCLSCGIYRNNMISDVIMAKVKPGGH